MMNRFWQTDKSSKSWSEKYWLQKWSNSGVVFIKRPFERSRRHTETEPIKPGWKLNAMQVLRKELCQHLLLYLQWRARSAYAFRIEMPWFKTFQKWLCMHLSLWVYLMFLYLVSISWKPNISEVHHTIRYKFQAHVLRAPTELSANGNERCEAGEVSVYGEMAFMKSREIPWRMGLREKLTAKLRKEARANNENGICFFASPSSRRVFESSAVHIYGDPACKLHMCICPAGSRKHALRCPFSSNWSKDIVLCFTMRKLHDTFEKACTWSQSARKIQRNILYLACLTTNLSKRVEQRFRL